MFILKALGNISEDTSYVRHTWTLRNWSINFSIISLDKKPWRLVQGVTINRSYLSSLPGELRILHERLLAKHFSLSPGQISQSCRVKASFFHRTQHLPHKSPVMPGRWTGKQTGNHLLGETTLYPNSYNLGLQKCIFNCKRKPAYRRPDLRKEHVCVTPCLQAPLSNGLTCEHICIWMQCVSRGVAATVKTVSVSIVKLIFSLT